MTHDHHPTDEAERLLGTMLDLLDQFRWHRDEIAKDAKPPKLSHCQVRDQADAILGSVRALKATSKGGLFPSDADKTPTAY